MRTERQDQEAPEEVTRYRIPQGNLVDLRAKIEKLNKRAAKLGCEPISITEHETETMLIVSRDNIADMAEFGYDQGTEREISEAKWEEVKDKPAYRNDRVVGRRTYVFVTVEGEAPKLADWTFVATIVPIADVGNLLRAVPGQKVPDKYRTSDLECDHCGYIRQRNATYVVRHEDGTHKQVGSNCLADFLGHRSPQSMAQWAQVLADLDDMVREYSGVGHTERTFDVTDYLQWVAAAIRIHGWKSKKYAWEYNDIATAHVADQQMFARRKEQYDEEVREAYTENKDGDKVIAALEWIRSLTEAEYGDSDYLWNLFATCSKEYMTFKEQGIVASLLSAYDREVLKIQYEKKQAERKHSQWVGEVKKRMKGIEVTLTFERTIERDPYDSQWGSTTYLYSFEDADGNEFKWFASNPQKWEVGETWKVDATVKKHDEYRGVQQTQVKRVTLKEKLAETETADA